MSTPIPDSVSYATAGDLSARFDIRDLCQWVSDTTIPVSQASLPTNVNLLAALADASGMVEAATLAAERYSVTDLQALAASGGNGAAFLKRLVCDLAIGLLIERRPFLEREAPPQSVRALDWLEQLRGGARIFAFVEAAAAGNPLVTYQSVSDVAARNLTSYQARRYFGVRAQESVPGPGNPSNVVP